MKKPKFILFALATTFSLFAFQNCGSSDGGKLALSSVNRVGEDFAPNQVLMRMKSDQDLEEMYQWGENEGLNLEFEREVEGENMAVWTWTTNLSVKGLIEKVQSQAIWEKVDFIEPNYILRAPGDSQDFPELIDPENGPIVGNSFEVDDISLFDSSARNEQAYAATGIDSLQGQGDTANPVLVAVIDTGLDVNHGFFVDSESIWQNSGDVPGDGIDNDGNGFVDDTNGWNFAAGTGDIKDDDGHGTHCAGIVLGVGNDILAATPPRSPIQIMGLKFIGSDGGRTSDAIQAIDYAMANGAQVLSNSWGGGGYSQALQRALANASNQGLFIAIAAGNDSSDNDSLPVFPANIRVPNSITVAATGSDDILASFSNFGRESVQLAAPGVQILSTYPSIGGVPQFNFLSGTSMATPFVAGTAAMVINGNPTLTGFDVKSLIIANADSIPGLSNTVTSSARLRSNTAKEAGEEAQSSGAQPQDPGSVSGQGGLGVANGSASDSGGGCGFIAGPPSDLPGLPGGGLIALIVLPVAILVALRKKARWSESRLSI